MKPLHFPFRSEFKKKICVQAKPRTTTKAIVDDQKNSTRAKRGDGMAKVCMEENDPTVFFYIFLYF